MQFLLEEEGTPSAGMHPKEWLVEVWVVHPQNEEAAHLLASEHVWCLKVFVFYTSETAPHQRGLVQHRISGH